MLNPKQKRRCVLDRPVFSGVLPGYIRPRMVEFRPQSLRFTRHAVHQSAHLALLTPDFAEGKKAWAARDLHAKRPIVMLRGSHWFKPVFGSPLRLSFRRLSFFRVSDLVAGRSEQIHRG